MRQVTQFSLPLYGSHRHSKPNPGTKGLLDLVDRTRGHGLRCDQKETPVGEIMTKELVTAEPNDNIAECMRIMTERRVRHLPVLERSKIIGIVSIGDLLKWVISAQDAAIDHLEKYITGSYPA